MKRRVVVTGIGALTPIGNNPQELWESVKAGKCGIDFIKNFDTSNHKVKLRLKSKNFNMDGLILRNGTLRKWILTVNMLLYPKTSFCRFRSGY